MTAINPKDESALAISCCGSLFYAHKVGKQPPLIVLECCVCGRLWHRREDGELVPYDKTLLEPAFSAMLYNDSHRSVEPEPPSE